MALFKAKVPAVEPPKSPVAKINLEAEVRSRVFDHLANADTAAAAGMSLDELRAFVERRYFPSAEQIMALAKAMDAPVSGLEVIRTALEVRLRGFGPSWGPSRHNRVPDRGVAAGDENPSSFAHKTALRAFVGGKDDAVTLETLNEFVADQWGPSAYYDPAADTLRKTDIAQPILTAPPPRLAVNVPPLPDPAPNAPWRQPPLYPRGEPKASRLSPGWS